MKIIFSLLVILTFSFQSFSQDSVAVAQLPANYFNKVEEKISSVDDKITKQTEKYLQKLQKQEDKIKRPLAKIDSSASATFDNAREKYNEFSRDIKSKAGKLTRGQYSSYLDTLGTSLNFLKQFNGVAEKVKAPLDNLQQLQSKLQQSEKIKKFIAERKERIKEMLSRYTKLPPGLKKQYEHLSKTAYYYSAQMKEYKEMLKNPTKIEQKALTLLKKIPAFQKFMRENSQFASLFGIPGSNPATQNITGLQTTGSVQSIIIQRVSMGGPNAMQQIQQNLANGHAYINKLKDQVNKLGGGSNDMEMPDFKPNDQKTKSFLKRLEFGSNIQSQKTTHFFPATADIGLSLGYKLNDKSIIGIGASYKLGIGKGWNNIHFSSEGIGLRSFIDYKIKKSFFISGGYEQNYRSAFASIDALKNNSGWQTSGLIGLTKKYKISKKIKGSAQLLWDFLSYNQIPRTQPIVYRIGYNLK